LTKMWANDQDKIDLILVPN